MSLILARFVEEGRYRKRLFITCLFMVRYVPEFVSLDWLILSTVPFRSSLSPSVPSANIPLYLHCRRHTIFRTVPYCVAYSTVRRRASTGFRTIPHSCSTEALLRAVARLQQGPYRSLRYGVWHVLASKVRSTVQGAGA